jgi:CheY-like chemotaxis protein
VARIVLVADDNAIIREALCRVFQVEEDYDLCAEATNGEEAIELAEKHRPDLIILDFSMPVMNGLEAARRLKEIMPMVPIILCTVHADLLMNRLEDLPAEMVVSKSDPNLMKHVRTLIPV